MKINAAQLRQLIKEEALSPMRSRAHPELAAVVQKQRLTEVVGPDEAVDDLEEIASQMASLNQQAMRLLDGLQGEGVLDGQSHTRAYRGWFAMIEQALSPESQWMGGTTMDTLAETIDTVKTALKPLSADDVQDVYEELLARETLDDNSDIDVVTEELYAYFENEEVPELMADKAIEEWLKLPRREKDTVTNA
jgi:hypothetical protein